MRPRERIELARQLRELRDGVVRNREHGFHDLSIAGAATQHAAQRVLDVIMAGEASHVEIAGFLIAQSDGGAGGADGWMQLKKVNRKLTHCNKSCIKPAHGTNGCA